jgi:hypothetical protein
MSRLSAKISTKAFLPLGATGAQGASGIGATGVRGATGTAGATGVFGATGISGATGIGGASGATGSTGLQGASGATGFANLFTAQFGPQTGATGATGSVQIRGSLQVGTGATGATGVITASVGIVVGFGATGATGSIIDTKGDVRAAPIQSKTAAYVLVAADAGQTISITTGGVTVNASVLSAGDIVSIFNNSGSNQTITQGTSVTLRFAGTATTGNRTLAQYGIATLLCVVGGATPTVVITGGGLT